MQGYIDENGKARIKLKVMGSEIDAVIDTGFEGDLSLPVQIATQLGLKLVGTETFELADGSLKQELIFSGMTKFGKGEEEVSIILTGSDDALLGTEMFSYLEINYEKETVKIG